MNCKHISILPDVNHALAKNWNATTCLLVQYVKRLVGQNSRASSYGHTHTHVTCADGQNNQMPLRAEGCLTRHHTHARARTTKAHARTCLNLHAYKGTRTYMSKCLLCRTYFVAVCYAKVLAATAALFFVRCHCLKRYLLQLPLALPLP